MAKPSLKFFHSGQLEGFRSASIMAYNDIHPDTLIRELVQNALDAGIRAERSKISIEFRLESAPTKSIPAYEDYQTRFEEACKTQKEKNALAQAESIVKSIKSTLDSPTLHVLWIMDNGIGLKPREMESLLGDGQSEKSDSASTGSYGNGHMTSFPASDLRYLIYGGVFSSEGPYSSGKIYAGHTILATHKHERELYSKDGFLVDRLHPNDLWNRYQFYDKNFPPLIENKLTYIEHEFGTGSAVGILGFNNFNKFDTEEKLVDCISTVVANHFTPIIYNGLMEVSIHTPKLGKKNINQLSLENILSKAKESVKSVRHGPTGQQAWQSLKTLYPQYLNKINTSAGVIHLNFRKLEPGDNSGGGGSTFSEMECGSPTVYLTTNHQHTSKIPHHFTLSFF